MRTDQAGTGGTVEARQLEHFVTIVDEGGFNRAAERPHVAQPSLSQAARALERDVALFHRLGRRAGLAEAGRAMLEPARQVLRKAEFARAAGARALDLAPAAELRISLVHRPVPLTPAAQRFADLALG
ncbi:LysR family transcriptional regulator [Saccharopolyspora gregorii]|uniref:HTH lysR-type domain-containing protein n=1 Tax=Saccharopolyspora gregorii TaxID=33914 RepID=A0ABP6RS18_9PSEU